MRRATSPRGGREHGMRRGSAARAPKTLTDGETRKAAAIEAVASSIEAWGPRTPSRRRPLRSCTTLWFEADNMVLTTAQAACVALPAAGVPRVLERFRGGAWALVLPLCIVAVIVAINETPDAADVLTWVALLLVPPGCALALGWAMHGARPWLAVLAAPLLAVAWTAQDTRAGQLATTLLVAGSCVTLGRLLAGAAPLTLLKLGIVAMAVVDAVLVFGNELQPANAVLVAASPGPGLPRLQSASFLHAGLGYGDFFSAGV